jgi:hypothetical protein
MKNIINKRRGGKFITKCFIRSTLGVKGTKNYGSKVS